MGTSGSPRQETISSSLPFPSLTFNARSSQIAESQGKSSLCSRGGAPSGRKKKLIRSTQLAQMGKSENTQFSESFLQSGANGGIRKSRRSGNEFESRATERSRCIRARIMGFPSSFTSWRAVAIFPTMLDGSGIVARVSSFTRAPIHLGIPRLVAGRQLLLNPSRRIPRAMSV